jgi:hypothetical protein
MMSSLLVKHHKIHVLHLEIQCILAEEDFAVAFLVDFKMTLITDSVLPSVLVGKRGANNHKVRPPKSRLTVVFESQRELLEKESREFCEYMIH